MARIRGLVEPQLDKAHEGKLTPTQYAALAGRTETEIGGMYVVVHGDIRSLARTGARGERLTGVAGPGSSFGEAVMFLERPAVVDAEAATDALVLHVPKAAVFEQIERSPSFARRIIAALSQRIEALVGQLDRQSRGGGRARLVDYLLRSTGSSPGPHIVELPAAKGAIAPEPDARAFLAAAARDGRRRPAAGARPQHHRA